MTAALALALLAAPARADLNFTQVTQAQTSAGAEGLFGKTWVELRGAQMRLVAGYARKVSSKGALEDPLRRVQILDVKERTLTSVDPERRSYSVGPLSAPDYGHNLGAALDRGAPERRIARHEVRLERRPGVKRLLGADCERWRVTVTMRLAALGGREEAARMDQDLWVAPLAGELAKSLMELIAFENAYRGAAGDALSPLDHERYQIKEAAAYLQVPAAELAKVAAAVRERLRELPSYPVASSVAWWRDEGRTVRPPEAASKTSEAALPRRKARSPRPVFKVIDWRRAERRIDGMIERTRSEFGEFPLGDLQAPRQAAAAPSRRVAPRFEEELRRILVDLVAQTAELEEQAAQLRPPPGTAAPFFEVYAELHGLEKPAVVAAGHFQLPKGYRKE